MRSPNHSLVVATDAVARTGATSIAGAVMAEHLPPGAHRALVREWADLKVDRYLPGGETYRRRRYGRVLATPCGDSEYEMATLPHVPFVQDAGDVPLYGGRSRVFAPIASRALLAEPMLALMKLNLEVMAEAGERVQPYVVGVHMVRVYSKPLCQTYPVPEGRHRDGHAYVAMHLISREGCDGGTSLVYGADDIEPMLEVLLNDPLDTLLVDDRRVEHAVTPVRGIGSYGLRDVLLLDYDPTGDE